MLKRRERHPLDRGKTISEFSVARPCDRSFSRNNLSLSLSMLHYALRKMTDIWSDFYRYLFVLCNFMEFSSERFLFITFTRSLRFFNGGIVRNSA